MSNKLGRKLLAVGTLALAGAAVSASALAQENYPTRPVKVVVSFPAGGAVDTVTRLVADKMSNKLGEAFVVENRGGAGGLVGTDYVKRAPADGYTLLVTNTGFVQTPVFSARPTFDPEQDFEPITQLNLAPTVFVIDARLPAKTLEEFIGLVKREPGKHSFGSGGVAQTLHLYGEMLNRTAGLDMAHSPFKGELLAINAIMAGHISGSFVTVATARPQIQAGTVRALAATGTERTPLLPDVPTFRELGYHQFDTVGWYGMFAPRGTPKPIISKLSEAAMEALRQPDVASRLNDLALTPVGNTPEETAKVIRDSLAAWRNIMKATGMEPQ